MLAYGYCRYSSDLQTEASIEQQKAEIEEYSIRNNIWKKKLINYWIYVVKDLEIKNIR